MLTSTRRGFIVLAAAFSLAGCGEFGTTTETLNTPIAVDTTPEQFSDRMRKDYDRYGRLVRSLGLGIQK